VAFTLSIQWPFGSFWFLLPLRGRTSLLLWTLQTLEGSEFGPLLPARTVSAGSDSNENNCKILIGFDMS